MVARLLAVSKQPGVLVVASWGAYCLHHTRLSADKHPHAAVQPGLPACDSHSPSALQSIIRLCLLLFECCLSLPFFVVIFLLPILTYCQFFAANIFCHFAVYL